MEVMALRTALKQALARKEAKRALLEQTLDKRAAYVQAASNGNKAAMMTSALGVQRKRHKVGPLEPPLGVRVTYGLSKGEVILTGQGEARQGLCAEVWPQKAGSPR